MTHIRGLVCGVIAILGLLALPARQAHAYVEAAHSFGQVVNLSSNILLMRVESVDKQNNVIVFRKVRDIKGKHPTEIIRHNIGRGGFHPREWQVPMQWAEVGKTAVFFHNGGASETCLGKNWYQAYGGNDNWGLSHGEPFLLRTFCGKPEKLVSLVSEMLNNKEVLVPCMIDGNKDDLHLARAKIQRLRASLKLQDYNQKRDFAGWGDEDFRRVTGLPGFTHYSALTRVDPEAQAISAVDINGDGKYDLCMAGAGKVALFQNDGEALGEISLPNVTGCRAAVWADYNGDGKPDLLLATPTGPRLFTNLGDSFRDDTHLLPREACYNLTSAAWIDYDGDGRPDILLGNGFHGLRLYRNKGKAEVTPGTPSASPGRKPGEPPPGATWFEDVSSKVGLGPTGIGSATKGDTLTIADVDGDGRPDFLYGAGNGMLVLNKKDGFVEAKDSGISYKSGRIGPVFADFDNDGYIDLFVPQMSGPSKLFKNDGKGKFTDVTEKAGDLAKPLGQATCAAWGDFDNDGRLDLVVGCLRGPNRFFRNKGDGTFEDATEAVGLNQRVFNTQSVCLVDLNNDGVLDMVFNNEGQESCVLLGNTEYGAKQSALTLQIKSTSGVVGSKVKVTDKNGKLQGCCLVSGGDGRGGQTSPQPRFALKPGTYRVEVEFTSGVKRARDIVVATGPMRETIDDQTPKVD